MADLMNFPDNPMDFIKQYEFKDTEEIYTNGSMLIPSFRVITMLMHYKQALLDGILEELNEMKSAPKTECSWNNGWTSACDVAIHAVKERGR